MSALMTFLFVAGLALIAYGCWLVYEPAGVITAGLELAAVAFLFERGS